MQKQKFIFVTGGVVSGLGKGITAASLGRLLKQRGYRVTLQKFDPYLNVDPGTMSPYQHGEVFVTDDGSENDLDVGHYERFIDENLNKFSNITMGKIYMSVLGKERQGAFDGGTVQVVPHITNEIKERIYSAARSNNSDVIITEIGGTVGDIESHPFLEAIRQVPFDVGRENVLYIHVTLLPFIKASGEQKTKPTQHSVGQLQSVGIQPDIIVCRTERKLDQEAKNKIALFCNVERDCVIDNLDAESLYQIPLLLEKEGLGKVACRKLSLTDNPPDLKAWEAVVEKIIAERYRPPVHIGLVGKYTSMHDAYLSVVEAVHHASYDIGSNIIIEWIEAGTLENDEKAAALTLSKCDGIIVPGGFGGRGVPGKIFAAKYARENNIPYLGICLGMHAACIEFARNVIGLKDADSGEFDSKTKNPIFRVLEEKAGKEPGGGALRLGAWKCKLAKNSGAQDMYDAAVISERHRHRYEFNNDYIKKFEAAGMSIDGICPDNGYVEIVSLPGHKWFYGVQFQPEFKSRPDKPHPLFSGFVTAAAGTAKRPLK